MRAAGEADILATYQGKTHGQTLRVQAAGPRSSFSNGTFLVNRDILSGRYFSDPASGCYWERLRGLGGTLGDIISNDFVGYNAGQLIVDIASSDLAFKTDNECGTWTNSQRRGLANDITPGVWLVGAQISPGNYAVNAGPGCYWERLRNFSGELNGIIANDFMSSGGRVLVAIQAGDVGFTNDADCGTWTRVQSQTTESIHSAASADENIATKRAMRRQRYGLTP